MIGYLCGQSVVIQALCHFGLYYLSYKLLFLPTFLKWLCNEFFHILLQGLSVKMVAAGAEHTAAVTEDGSLYGWGWGRYGNLGLGDRNDRMVPERVSMVNVSLKIWCFLFYSDFGHHL